MTGYKMIQRIALSLPLPRTTGACLERGRAKMSLALAHKNDAARPIDPTRDVKKIKKNLKEGRCSFIDVKFSS